MQAPYISYQEYLANEAYYLALATCPLPLYPMIYRQVLKYSYTFELVNHIFYENRSFSSDELVTLVKKNEKKFSLSQIEEFLSGMRLVFGWMMTKDVIDDKTYELRVIPVGWNGKKAPYKELPLINNNTLDYYALYLQNLHKGVKIDKPYHLSTQKEGVSDEEHIYNNKEIYNFEGFMMCSKEKIKRKSEPERRLFIIKKETA